MTRSRWYAVVAIYSLCLVLQHIPRQELFADEFDVDLEADIKVPMRDGVELGTDVYFPMKDGRRIQDPLPAVLTRTPYGKSADWLLETLRFFARRGYVSVVQDVRGQLNAPEAVYPTREADDGFDTVQWIAKQPWCNGKVGMHGASALANTQFAAATQSPGALTTIIPCQGTTNFYHGLIRVGGALHLGMLWGAVSRSVSADDPSATANAIRELAKLDQPPHFLRWAYNVPWERGKTPLAEFPDHEDAVFTMYFEEPDYTEFWRTPSMAMDEYLAKTDGLPTLWLVSWQDWNVLNNTRAYEKMVAAGHQDQYLIIGPWSHFAFHPYAGDVNFSNQGARIGDYEGWLEAQLKWFDRWLKGNKATDIGPKVQYFVMGGGDGRRGEGGRLNHGGRWCAGTSWPPTNVRKTRFYLHASGGLSTQRPSLTESSTSYWYDPLRTVNSVGKTFMPFGPIRSSEGESRDFTVGPRDLIEFATLPGHCVPGRRITERDDVITFETDPLPSDITVAGDIEAALWIASDAPDTDFFVRLVDVYPKSKDYHDGYQFPVSEGILRARYRDGFEKPHVMTPGETYQLRIPLEPTANRFTKGHCIQIYICSSNFPTYDVNRNTGDPLDKRHQPARNTVFHSRSHCSSITLPVVID